MKATSTEVGAAATGKHQVNTRALFVTALFLVTVCAFILHVTLVYAPLQGADLEHYYRDVSTGRPAFASVSEETVFRGPLSGFGVRGLWRLGNGGAGLLRVVSLLLHVAVSLLVFLVIWLWLARPRSVLFPLLGGLLAAVSTAAPPALAGFAGWPALLMALFGLVASALFLSGTAPSYNTGHTRILLACCCIAAATAAQYNMVLTPLFLLALGLTRVRDGYRGRWTVAPAACVLMVFCAVVLFLAVYVSAGLSAFDGSFPDYLLSVLIILAGVRIAAVPRLPVLRRVLCGLMAVLACIGAVLSYQMSMRFVEPVPYLEQQVAESADVSSRRTLALHYYDMASRSWDGDARLAFLQQAVSVWPMEEEAEAAPWECLLVGRSLLELGDSRGAAAALSPAIAEAPFTDVGLRAARLKASVIDEAAAAQNIAGLFAFVAREDMLTPEELVRYGRALMSMGDFNRAVETFAALPAFLPEDSVDGQVQRLAARAFNAARALRDTYEQSVAEDPLAVDGYVALAESNLILANYLNAFYWLDVVLRRAPDNEQAWTMLGALFARQAQAEHFIKGWGASRDDTPTAWFSLARQVAQEQVWDEAFKYMREFARHGDKSAEEYLGGLALEQQQPTLAEQWLLRALEIRPEDYGLLILLSDAALARDDRDGARSFLEEAERLGAPQQEIAKRRATLQGSREEPPARDEPFEPVRTYIR